MLRTTLGTLCAWLLLTNALGCSNKPDAGTGTSTDPSMPQAPGVIGTGAQPGGAPDGNSAAGAAGAGASANTPSTDPAATPAGGPSDPANGTPASGAVDATDPTTPFAMLPDNCKGFEVLGLTNSPGGDVLPNTCAPYNSLFNNPYAIRCVDADPSFSTGYPGDEFCILPPDPTQGTQVQVAPADLANPDAKFIMQPGEEVTDYYYTKAPNAEEHWFYRVNVRMRAGSHHMINRMLDAAHADGWSAVGDGIGQSSGSRSFPGAQRPDTDRPQGTFEVPPENAGLGDHLLANQQFSLNLHHFNFTDKPELRQVWINIWYKDKAEVTDEMGGIAIFGNPLDVAVPAGEHRELHYRCDVTGNTRIITLNGHRHTWTDRFGVWLEKASGETVPLYESFDYSDMPTYQYDSISMNPTPDLATKTDGALTGLLNVVPGDQLHFVCDINNTSSQQLRFANEVMTGEMCILFGSRTGDALCGSGTRVQ